MKGQPHNRNSSGTPSWWVGRGMWPQVWPLQPDAGPVTQTKLKRAAPLVPLAGLSRGRPPDDPRVRRARSRPSCGDQHPTALQPRGTEGPFLVRGWGWSPAQGRCRRRPHSTEGQGLSPRSGGLLPWGEGRQRRLPVPGIHTFPTWESLLAQLCWEEKLLGPQVLYKNQQSSGTCHDPSRHHLGAGAGRVDGQALCRAEPRGGDELSPGLRGTAGGPTWGSAQAAKERLRARGCSGQVTSSCPEDDGDMLVPPPRILRRSAPRGRVSARLDTAGRWPWAALQVHSLPFQQRPWAAVPAWSPRVP